jgi:hypothetical protein
MQYIKFYMGEGDLQNLLEKDHHANVHINRTVLNAAMIYFRDTQRLKVPWPL